MSLLQDFQTQENPTLSTQLPDHFKSVENCVEYIRSFGVTDYLTCADSFFICKFFLGSLMLNYAVLRKGEKNDVKSKFIDAMNIVKSNTKVSHSSINGFIWKKNKEKVVKDSKMRIIEATSMIVKDLDAHLPKKKDVSEDSMVCLTNISVLEKEKTKESRKFFEMSEGQNTDVFSYSLKDISINCGVKESTLSSQRKKEWTKYVSKQIGEGENSNLSLVWNSEEKCCMNACCEKLVPYDNILKSYYKCSRSQDKKVEIGKYRNAFFGSQKHFPCISILKCLFRDVGDNFLQSVARKQKPSRCSEDELKEDFSKAGHDSSTVISAETISLMKEFFSKNIFNSPKDNVIIGPAGVHSWEGLCDGFNSVLSNKIGPEFKRSFDAIVEFNSSLEKFGKLKNSIMNSKPDVKDKIMSIRENFDILHDFSCEIVDNLSFEISDEEGIMLDNIYRSLITLKGKIETLIDNAAISTDDSLDAVNAIKTELGNLERRKAFFIYSLEVFLDKRMSLRSSLHRISATTLKKYLRLSYPGKKLLWMASHSAQCDKCFTSFTKIKNLENEISDITSDLHRLNALIACCQNGSNVSENDLTLLREQYLEFEKKMRDAKSELEIEKEKKERHQCEVTRMVMQVNDFQEYHEIQNDSMIILFDYKQGASLPAGISMSQNEFLSGGKRTVVVFGVIVKMRLQNILCSFKYIFLSEKQFVDENWECIQGYIECA